MVLIFGWGAGEAKDLGAVAPAVCPNCHNQVFMHYIRSEKKVSLYFVPVMPYGTDEYLACPTCHQGLQIRPEQRPEVTSMQAATTQYRLGRYLADAYTARVERFWRALGVAPSGAQLVRPSPTVPPPRAPGPGLSTTSPASAPTGAALEERLRGLARLHAAGNLSDEEFAAAKRHLLGI